jgi:hypothetical protein
MTTTAPFVDHAPQAASARVATYAAQATAIARPRTAPLTPTTGQRLVLAIVSVVLLVPLSALTAALVIPLASSLPGWLDATITTLAQVVICAAVVGVNLAYSGGALKLRER